MRFVGKGFVYEIKFFLGPDSEGKKVSRKGERQPSYRLYVY